MYPKELAFGLDAAQWFFVSWLDVGWLVGWFAWAGKKLTSEVYIEQVKKLLHLELGYLALKNPRKLNKKKHGMFFDHFCIMILSWYPKLGVAY